MTTPPFPSRTICCSVSRDTFALAAFGIRAQRDGLAPAQGKLGRRAKESAPGVGTVRRPAFLPTRCENLTL